MTTFMPIKAVLSEVQRKLKHSTEVITELWSSLRLTLCCAEFYSSDERGIRKENSAPLCRRFSPALMPKRGSLTLLTGYRGLFKSLFVPFSPQNQLLTTGPTLAHAVCQGQRALLWGPQLHQALPKSPPGVLYLTPLMLISPHEQKFHPQVIHSISSGLHYFRVQSTLYQLYWSKPAPTTTFKQLLFTAACTMASGTR